MGQWFGGFFSQVGGWAAGQGGGVVRGPVLLFFRRCEHEAQKISREQKRQMLLTLNTHTHILSMYRVADRVRARQQYCHIARQRTDRAAYLL